MNKKPYSPYASEVHFLSRKPWCLVTCSIRVLMPLLMVCPFVTFSHIALEPFLRFFTKHFTKLGHFRLSILIHPLYIVYSMIQIILGRVSRTVTELPGSCRWLLHVGNKPRTGLAPWQRHLSAVFICLLPAWSIGGPFPGESGWILALPCTRKQ